MKNYLSIAALTLLLVSCGKDQIKENSGTETGKLVFGSLSSNGSFIPVNTRADGDSDVDTDSFVITLVNSAGETYASYTFGNIKETSIELPADDYKIHASSPDTAPVAFDQPIYSGDKEVTIQPSVLETVTIDCSIENMKVTIIFEDSFKGDLENYKVVVSSDDGFLTFNEDNEGKAGFFAVNPLKFEVTANRISDGGAVAQTFYANEVGPKTHHIVRLTTTPNGSAGLDINIDYTLDEKEIVIVIEDDDDDNGDGGNTGGDGDEITIEGPGIGTAYLMNDTEANMGTSVIDVAMTTPAGFAKLIVTIESRDLIEEGLLEAFGLPAEFDLCNLEKYIGEYEEIVNNLILLGLIESADQVKDKTGFIFSVGNLVSLLTSGGDGFYGTEYESYLDHYFHLYVEDNDGNHKEDTLWVRRIKDGYTGE